MKDTKQKKEAEVDERGQLLWYVYDITTNVMVDCMANGVMADAMARIRSEKLGHRVIVGYLYN